MPTSEVKTGSVWAGVVRLSMCDQPCRHPRCQWDVAPSGAALQPPALAAVELLADLHVRIGLQLHVLPGQADHLGDPQAGMDEELEDQRAAMEWALRFWRPDKYTAGFPVAFRGTLSTSWPVARG